MIKCVFRFPFAVTIFVISICSSCLTDNQVVLSLSRSSKPATNLDVLKLGKMNVSIKNSGSCTNEYIAKQISIFGKLLPGVPESKESDRIENILKRSHYKLKFESTDPGSYIEIYLTGNKGPARINNGCNCNIKIRNNVCFIGYINLPHDKSYETSMRFTYYPSKIGDHKLTFTVTREDPDGRAPVSEKATDDFTVNPNSDFDINCTLVNINTPRQGVNGTNSYTIKIKTRPRKIVSNSLGNLVLKNYYCSDFCDKEIGTNVSFWLAGSENDAKETIFKLTDQKSFVLKFISPGLNPYPPALTLIFETPDGENLKMIVNISSIWKNHKMKLTAEKIQDNNTYWKIRLTPGNSPRIYKNEEFEFKLSSNSFYLNSNVLNITCLRGNDDDQYDLCPVVLVDDIKYGTSNRGYPKIYLHDKYMLTGRYEYKIDLEDQFYIDIVHEKIKSICELFGATYDKTNICEVKTKIDEVKSKIEDVKAKIGREVQVKGKTKNEVQCEIDEIIKNAFILNIIYDIDSFKNFFDSFLQKYFSNGVQRLGLKIYNCISYIRWMDSKDKEEKLHISDIGKIEEYVVGAYESYNKCNNLIKSKLSRQENLGSDSEDSAYDTES